MKVLVTGGAGFIGSAVVRHLLARQNFTVLNVDKLTYAGNLESLSAAKNNSLYSFKQVDILESTKIEKIFADFAPDWVMHLAAESHVDRSIDGPADFIQTNICGTYCVLDAAQKYWKNLVGEHQKRFRFLHISTDEVFGSLGETGYFTEQTSYDPRSPYSASKASSDHLVRAWYHTYNLPTIITNCSNNYGPYQFPEKLIPLMIIKGLKGESLPVYGKGDNVRDWLYVEDHVKALIKVLESGKPGETYNIGGNCEKTNLEVVRTICQLLDEVSPHSTIKDRTELITFVTDRPGHDKRYAIDFSKIKQELGWSPIETFESAMRTSIEWYLKNTTWWERVLSGEYRGERLGLGEKE